MNKKILFRLFCVVVVLFMSGCAEEKASIPENEIVTDTALPVAEEVQQVRESAPISPEEGPIAQEIPIPTEALITEEAPIIKQEFPRKDIDLFFGICSF